MATVRTSQIYFKSQKSGGLKPGEMKVACYDVRQKRARAFKSLLLLWLLAGISVVVPVAHFFLVPAFLAAGIFVAVRRWRTTEEGLQAAGTCPSCSKPITISLDGGAELPQWHDCPACGEPLMLLAAKEKNAAQ